MRISIIIGVWLGLGLAEGGLRAQTPDWLPSTFHQQRREALRQKLPKNSVAVVFANPIRNRSNDVDYVYHPDPDFYYLTGLREPHAMLLVFAQSISLNGEQVSEVIFVQPRNRNAEMWNGKRMGVAGVQQMGFDLVMSNLEFAQLDLDFAQFDKVIFHQLRDDIHDTDNPGDLASLQDQFADKAAIPPNYSSLTKEVYELIRTGEGSANVAKTIGRILKTEPSLAEDPYISLYYEAKSKKAKEKAAEQIPQLNLDTRLLKAYMNDLREVKTAAELTLLRRAVRISTQGQIEVMKAMHPGMSEREIQGIHEFVFKKYGAEYEGYPSIVGAGHNGCVLHYISNDLGQVDSNLVLMDLGAQYRGYTADVTRTIPANGHFSQEQRAIYELVYQAQSAGIAVCKPGTDFRQPHMEAMKVIAKGLMELGITESLQEAARYFPHGTSHYIGLDVHDRGNYGPLQPNMVITVEPGIYIPENSPCDPKWWGIAVRIEDDILITEKGWENLSADAPRKWQEIEALMQQPSALDDFLLPNLDE